MAVAAAQNSHRRRVSRTSVVPMTFVSWSALSRPLSRVAVRWAWTTPPNCRSTSSLSRPLSSGPSMLLSFLALSFFVFSARHLIDTARWCTELHLIAAANDVDVLQKHLFCLFSCSCSCIVLFLFAFPHEPEECFLYPPLSLFTLIILRCRMLVCSNAG